MTYTKDNLPKVGDVILIGGKRATCDECDLSYKFTYDGGQFGFNSFTTDEVIGMEYERPHKPLTVAERWTALCYGNKIVTSEGIAFAFDQESDKFRWNHKVSAGLESLKKVDDPNETWYLVEDA